MDEVGKKSKYDRILSLYSLLEAGEVVIKSEAAHRFGVNERTVQRDIDDIRAYYDNNTFGMDHGKKVVYDRSLGGFRILETGETVMTEGEILTVCKILLESRSLTKSEMMPILDKLISGGISADKRKEVSNLIANERFHYVEPRHGKALVENLSLLGKAVREQRVVEIEYLRMKDTSPVARRVKPVGVMMSEFYFYLIAYIAEEDPREPSDPARGPAIYRVDRITKLSVTREHFYVPYASRFEEGEFRKRVQFMYGGPLRTVRFTYSGESVEAVLDRLPTAKILSESDGVYTVEAEVFGSGIEMWLRSQGDKVSLIGEK